MSITVETVASALAGVAIWLAAISASRRARRREREWLLSQPASFREERVPLLITSWLVGPNAWGTADVHVLGDSVCLCSRSVVGIHRPTIWLRRSAGPMRRPVLLSSRRTFWLDSVVRDESSLVLKARIMQGSPTTSIRLEPRDLDALIAALETTPATGPVARDPHAAADAAMCATLDRASSRRASSRES